jgi:ADP-heptose:LPS heptosyltransferase
MTPPALVGASSVVVLRALPGLGDLLCLVPALRSLRAGLPAAHVTLLGVPEAAWFVERFRAYVDELLVLPAFPGLPEVGDDAREAVAFCALAQSRRFDLALQLHGDGFVANTLVALLGATVTAGTALPGRWSPDPARFVPHAGDLHEIDRLRAVPLALGLPDMGPELELHALPGDVDDAAMIKDRLPVGPFACVHPGASLASRRWPEAEFAVVVDQLHRAGLEVVLTGSASERRITAEVTAACPRPPVDLAGCCSLGALAHVLRRATLVVTNDTGVSHLAAAVRAPSVVVFTGSDPTRWAPLDRERHRAVAIRPSAAAAELQAGVRAAVAEQLARWTSASA